ncbi:MAG TPA: AI-2E family transporter [Pseudomonadota bacterium]|nr:AI-2E family transporter [Pseudomonadota bacterium]
MLPTSTDPSPSPSPFQSVLRGGPLQQRVLALILFVAILAVFRHLALILVTFVVLSRALAFLGLGLARLLGLRGPKAEHRGVLLVLALGVLLLSGLAFVFVKQGGKSYEQFLSLHNGQSLPEILRDFHEDLLERLPAWLPIEGLKERVPHMVQPAVDYLRATGRVLMYLLIGLILAIIYVLDRKPVDTLFAELPSESVPGTLRRYFGYLCEAIIITITLQVLVALVNTLLTLPVLLALRLPRIPALTALIFFSSLVPVVGNLVSGAVLIVTSYLHKGLWAVAFFVVTTFVLHKIEAYYLNPRLAARHVNLPSLILVISLILHEHIFGLVGLFLSFPVLYIGLNILHELRAALGTDPAADGSPPSSAGSPPERASGAPDGSAAAHVTPRNNSTKKRRR